MDMSRHIENIRESGMAALGSIHGLERLELIRLSDGIVEAYGRVYKANRALIVDDDVLPYSKDSIKAALKVKFHSFAIRNQIDAMEDIAKAYTGLSRFQHIDEGDKPYLEELNNVSIPKTDLFETKNESRDLNEQERVFLESFARFNFYLGRIETDKEALKIDFAEFINGFKK